VQWAQFAYTAHSCSRAFTCCRNKLYNLSIFITRVRPRQCALLFLSRSFCHCLQTKRQQFYVNTHLKSLPAFIFIVIRRHLRGCFILTRNAKQSIRRAARFLCLLSAEQMYVVHTHSARWQSASMYTLTQISGAALSPILIRCEHANEGMCFLGNFH